MGKASEGRDVQGFVQGSHPIHNSDYIKTSNKSVTNSGLAAEVGHNPCDYQRGNPEPLYVLGQA